MNVFDTPVLVTVIKVAKVAAQKPLFRPTSHLDATIKNGVQGKETFVDVHASVTLKDNEGCASVSTVTRFILLTPFSLVTDQMKMRMIDAGCQSAVVEFQREYSQHNSTPPGVVFPSNADLERILHKSKTSTAPQS